MKDRIIFHIDVNSAFLSWEAVYRLQQGEKIDLRKISSVIGGDEKNRHGVVLAKSTLAKNFGIKTGESLFSAKQKCPELVVIPPRHDLYMLCSSSMIELFKEYTPIIEKFSIDECFLDFTAMENLYESPIKLAYEIKDRIRQELGFTVNVGISNNKLLAKMASDFKKPDKVHTLFPEEIQEKMWMLPIEDLYMVGKATVPKLNDLNIFTIGDLANYDLHIIKDKFKSYGTIIWNYANGIESSIIERNNSVKMKSISNSTTLASDIKDKEKLHLVILSLAENVGTRLRNAENFCTNISIGIKNEKFNYYSKQRKLNLPMDSTTKIAKIACELLDEVWKGEPVRLLSVSVSELCANESSQTSLFDDKDINKNKVLDSVIDEIRNKYGNNS